jgi:ribosomal protein S26
MKKCYLESRSRGISYMKYVNGRLTGLVTFCVETAFYDRLLKERGIEVRERRGRRRRKLLDDLK